MTSNESPNVKPSVDLEKSASVEHVSTSGMGSEVELSEAHGFTEKERKKLMRRIDLRLLPILGLIYCISLIDRTNLGMAMIAGMSKDLGMSKGNRYSIVVLIFFVAYIIFEIPSNLILPRAGPANWLTFLGVGFGVVMLGMGFVKSWGTLAVCRFLLGALEAGFMPGCAYLISCWYTRYEVGRRLTAFAMISIIVGAFASIMTYGLSRMAGKGGLNGWNWIFIIEGAITIFVALIGRFIIIDFPNKASGFLTPREQGYILDLINQDRGDAKEDAVTRAKILHHLADWKLYFWAFNLLASAMPGYALVFFMPIILHDGMGFSTADSMLLMAPPAGLATILALAAAWASDKYKMRGPIVAFFQLISAVGLLVLTYSRSNGAKYFGGFMCYGFLAYTAPGILTFQANNITSHSKRAVASATCLIGGGVGGIIASVAFTSKESPRYLHQSGVWTTVALLLASIVLILIMDVYLWRRNKAAREGKVLNEGISGWMYTL
ncbi:hypothetical protein PspLS_10040 [Pyricularia sp. CBS 133598]|nr:hypothetical protein PspLS_10040 [Pyricularia sp. CBS 133598]